MRLHAENKGLSRVGAWARATLDFPAPYRNLAGAGAFGVWIKGDGKGALLNLQLGTPREFIHALSDHYVTLDFKGWRYVELLVRERDVERMGDYSWPYGGAYDIYRNPLDMSHISQVTLYLNDLPAGERVDVTVSPVMALPTHSAALKSPVLTVNGKTLALPFTLASGDFAELEPDGINNTWDVAVRPNEKANLEIELCGAMGSPALTVGGQTVRFPVTLKGGERLLCRDGRHWTVLDAQRATVSKGTLDAKVPVLQAGSTRIAFTCAAPARAQVKLVKVYE